MALENKIKKLELHVRPTKKKEDNRTDEEKQAEIDRLKAIVYPGMSEEEINQERKKWLSKPETIEFLRTEHPRLYKKLYNN